MSQKMVSGIEDVIATLKRECDASGGQLAWGKANGFSSAFVSDVVNLRRSPSERLLTALGIKKVTRYEL